VFNLVWHQGTDRRCSTGADRRREPSRISCWGSEWVAYLTWVYGVPLEELNRDYFSVHTGQCLEVTDGRICGADPVSRAGSVTPGNGSDVAHEAPPCPSNWNAPRFDCSPWGR